MTGRSTSANFKERRQNFGAALVEEENKKRNKQEKTFLVPMLEASALPLLLPLAVLRQLLSLESIL